MSGRYRLCVRAHRAPKAPLAENEPPGTQWVLARIFTERLEFVADVGFYRRPDGTIGGTSGKPDPKEMVIDGRRFRVPAKPVNW